MDDGVKIAGTLYVPDGTPPPDGWPALVFLHGLGGTRQSMNQLVESAGFAGSQYAVLTFDARGHGQSGGLVTIDGPREVADTRYVRDWLDGLPEVSSRIGAWGISYGGGAVWNSLVAGVPWTAVEVVETWTDLYEALVPQGLVKSGLVIGLSSEIPDSRKDPSLAAVQAAALTGTNPALVRAWAAARSSIRRLGNVRTPVFMMQGRRDFLFGTEQATRAYAALKGPKRLYLGLHGHAPSTFPASDTAIMLAEGKQWFDRYLRGIRNGIDTRPPVEIAAERPIGVTASFKAPLQPVRALFPLRGNSTLLQGGKVVRRLPAQKGARELYGSPTVTVKLMPSGGWSRLVAVLTARTPDGREIVVSAGGVPVTASSRSVTIRLINQITWVPAGSRLVVTLASASTAQNPGNLLYLDRPMPRGAKVKIGDVSLGVPFLEKVITK
jgi:predicted acyl esterase